MTEAVHIVLDGEQPVSMNKFYAGMHWTKRKQLADEKHLLIRSQVDPNQEPFNVPVHIFFTVYRNTKRLQDIDNKTVKMYIDGLKPFVIHDDDWRFVKAITRIDEYDKHRPRVEIEVRPWGDL